MADEAKTTIVIKKIKKAAHGHHGGAWKVAYADFVTAMMAFFLVMWIMGMGKKEKEGIQRYFNDPLKYLLGSERIFLGVFEANNGEQMMSAPESGGVTDSKKSGGVSRMHFLVKELQSGLVEFKEEIYDFKIMVDKIQFAITAQSLFAPGSALLKPEAAPILEKLAKVIQSMNANILVEAHTDDLPTDSPEFPTNWELSAVRSATVVRYFIEGHNFDPTKITAMAAAEFRPISDNRTPEGRAKNRRIDVYIVPEDDNRLNMRVPASGEVPNK